MLCGKIGLSVQPFVAEVQGNINAPKRITTMANQSTKPSPINIKNKRASFDYEFIDTYTAGIVLTGTEIKSIRAGKASLVDTFCFFTRGEMWVKNNHVDLLSNRIFGRTSWRH